MKNLQSTTYNLKPTKAFTLVETLVAIAILLLAIGGPLTIAAQSFFAARFSKDNLTAIYLAQEGIEMFRFRRDTNVLNSEDWLYGLDNCLGDNKCIMVGTNAGATSLCGVECVPLRISGNDFYAYASSYEVTKFTREINAQELNENEIVVTSIVKWTNGSVEREVELKESLFNWR